MPEGGLLTGRVPPVVALALAASGLWIGMRWFENLNLYFPARDLFATPRVLGLAFEDVELVPERGVVVHGWWVPANAPADRKGKHAPTVLFCHGNAGNISSRLDKIQILHRLGVNILMFDYRGYGVSTGRPSEQGLYADAEAAYRHVTIDRKVPPERVVLHGESLGGAVAAELATRAPAGGLILESCFTSVVDMGKRVFPFLPVRLMVSQHYDTVSRLPQLTLPVLVMHSPQDDIVPYAMGVRLHEGLPGPKMFAPLRGDHNEGFLDSGESYPAAIAEFLKRFLGWEVPEK